MVIKVVAAVLVVGSLMGVNFHFKEKQNLQRERLAAQAQEHSRLVALQTAARQTELERQRLVQMQQTVQAERQLYRCVDQNGTISLQNERCPAASSVTWAQSVPVETPTQASLRQQEFNRQQAEARLRLEEARFAEASGTGNTSRTNYPESGVPESNVARCQSAKNARDQAYRLAGNNRGFEMIRSWNDMVYEACKGT